MPITALPTPPNRNSPTTFADDGDEFLGALPTFATEANTLEATVNAAEANCIAAAAAAGATIWVSGTTYAAGNARYSPIDFQTYRRKTAGAGTTDPSLDSTNWARLNVAAPSVTRTVRTSNTVLVEADRSTLIDITSGTFSQTFTAAATLSTGWFCWIRNSGTGDITLDPNASETIDGLTSFVMYPGEVRLVQCDGTGFYSVVLTSFVKTFTSSGTFTKPPGYSRFSGLLWGGGGGGGGGYGGGGGACAPLDFLAASIGTTQAVTIGAGGAAGANGGASTFVLASGGGYAGSPYSGRGGVPFGFDEVANPVPSARFASGSGSTANAFDYGGGGGYHTTGASTTSGIKSIYGGGGGVPSGVAGTSVYGGAGGIGAAAGTAPAGGGGSTGAGARGELRIWGIL